MISRDSKNLLKIIQIRDQILKISSNSGENEKSIQNNRYQFAASMNSEVFSIKSEVESLLLATKNFNLESEDIETLGLELLNKYNSLIATINYICEELAKFLNSKIENDYLFLQIRNDNNELKNLISEIKNMENSDASFADFLSLINTATTVEDLDSKKNNNDIIFNMLHAIQLQYVMYYSNINMFDQLKHNMKIHYLYLDQALKELDPTKQFLDLLGIDENHFTKHHQIEKINDIKNVNDIKTARDLDSFMIGKAIQEFKKDIAAAKLETEIPSKTNTKVSATTNGFFSENSEKNYKKISSHTKHKERAKEKRCSIC